MFSFRCSRSPIAGVGTRSYSKLTGVSSRPAVTQSHLDRVGVRLESFGARERNDRRRDPPEPGARQALHRDHADEVGGAQAAARTGRAGVGSTWFEPVA